MNIGEIVKDSLRYPLSDWKNYLILGIIAVIANLYMDVPSLMLPNGGLIYLSNPNGGLVLVLGIVGLIMGFFMYGYLVRIIESTLAGLAELPEFNAWGTMFIDGFKVLIMYFIYLIPLFVIGILGIAFFAQALDNSMSNLSALDGGTLLGIVILVLIAIVYTIIMIPISLMSIANMANNDSKLGAAFRFKEIFNKIGDIGWLNLVIWYIVTGIIYIALVFIVGALIQIIFSLIHPFVGGVLYSLIVVPFLYAYLFRSVALIYKSE